METRCNKGLTALIAAARQQSWMVVLDLSCHLALQSDQNVVANLGE